MRFARLRSQSSHDSAGGVGGAARERKWIYPTAAEEGGTGEGGGGHDEQDTRGGYNAGDLNPNPIPNPNPNPNPNPDPDAWDTAQGMRLCGVRFATGAVAAEEDGAELYVTKVLIG